MSPFSKITAFLIGAWLRWVRGYRIDARLRRELRRELQTAPGTLICANHASAGDGWFLRWMLGGKVWIVADARSPFAKPWSRLLFALGRTIPVSQRHGLYANRNAFGRVASRLARGEPVLIFPEGTERTTEGVDVDQYSYLVGKLRRDRPGLRVLCLLMRGTAECSSLSWKIAPPAPERTGLRAVRDLGRQINATLKELELASR